MNPSRRMNRSICSNDIVSKNGNRLLDVGPEAAATIPTVQMERLQALGAWRKQNGAAIYGTHPWARAEGETAEGMRVRFTLTDSAICTILLGKPKTGAITSKSLSPKPRKSSWLAVPIHLPGPNRAVICASICLLHFPANTPMYIKDQIKDAGSVL